MSEGHKQKDDENPFIAHANSFEQADMLRFVRRQVKDGDMPSMADIERIVALAIEAHDAMSVIGGGEVIEFGPLASAIVEIAESGADKEQAEELIKS